MATIRLLLDEDVPRSLADTARRRGFDVVHTTEVGLSHRPDEVVLAAAVASGRAAMTHNVRHYVPLAHEYARTGRKHRGIVLSNGINPEFGKVDPYRMAVPWPPF